MILLVLAGTAIVWFSLNAAQQVQHRAELRVSSSRAVGEITRLWSPGRSPKFKIRYRFTANGEAFTGEAQVPAQLVHPLAESTSLPIVYLAANPTVNHPAAWEWAAISNWDWFIAPIVLALPATTMLLSLRRERYLVAEGVPALASVTQCSGNRSGFQMSYEFRAEKGTVTTGKGWYQDRQEIGARICVLYLPRNPRRNQPYPSLNYRAVQ